MKLPENAVDHVRSMTEDTSVSPNDRGDMLTYAIGEHGIDLREAIRRLIVQADAGREYLKKKEEEGGNALALERYVGSLRKNGKLYAIVSHGNTDLLVRASADVIKDLRAGQRVLLDLKEEQLVGSDGECPESGEIVKIVSRPDDMPGHAVIEREGKLGLTRLSEDLMESPDQCGPDKEVLYDPGARFAIRPISTSCGGDELLADLSSLEIVRSQDIGAPKKVVSAILERVRCQIEHPDWCQAVKTRQRTSYLFVGGTGTGKSYHLKKLMTDVHDLVEHYTGKRESRVVMLDCADFWAPYFGETEMRITRWAHKLESLGSRQLTGRDGKPLHFPIFVCLEEAESLLRGRGEPGSGHLYDRALSLFLKLTESLETALQAPIIWLATSNRPDLCDAAALRRVGVRQVTFGSQSAAEALSVLKTKLADEVPIRANGVPPEQARAVFMQRVINYLYGSEPRQAIAEVHLGDGTRRTLERSDVVTPAVLEEAVSETADRCLRNSHRAGRMIGLDADDMVNYLHRHFVNLARTLRPHNLAEHCADWYSRENLHVTRVVPTADEQPPLTLVG